MTPLADKLDKDVARLVAARRTADYQTAQVANGAKELMDEIGASKVTGEEDRYSHTDLYDFQANVEGARAVFDAIEPLLEQRAPTLAARRSPRNSPTCRRALAPHRRGRRLGLLHDGERPRTSGASFRAQSTALAEPLSKMSAIVAQ